MSLKDMFNENAQDMMPLEHAVRSGNRAVVDILLRQRAAAAAAALAAADTAKAEPAKKAIKIMKPITLKTGRRH